jgi:ribokinase
MSEPKICVVGSSNIDLIAKIPRLPKMGETLLGRYFHMSCGGKGANQAVMAGKLGAQISIVTKVGQDHLGEIIRKNYDEMGVDSTYIFTSTETSSGVAPILVDDEGRNLLVYIPGANMLLSPEDVQRAAERIAEANVLVCQLEIPLESTRRALQIAREHNVRTIFNPAPGQSLSSELLKLCDVVVPNETETEIITGLPVDTEQQIEAAGRRLREMGCAVAVITLGQRGAVLVSEKGTEHFPAEKTEAADTTGAGDAFVGSLAYFLAQGRPLQESIRRANTIAAYSVGRVGTQVSFPWRDEIAELLG